MKLFRVGVLLLVAGAAACKNDTGGSVVTLPPLAAIRYINLVPDTSALDVRIVDAVSYAPNTQNATFRTGGFPDGVSLAGAMPLYSPVAAGQHEIRVFLNGGSPSVSSTVMVDTTVTLTQGMNYTFYVSGYSRTGQNPHMTAFITTDTVPSTPAGQFALRVVHLAPTMAGATTGLATTAVDVWLDTLAVGAAVVGPPTFSNVNYGDVRAYQFRTSRSTPALNYRVAMAAVGTTTPIVAAVLPAGAAGNSTTNPIAGSQVPLTGITALLTSRTVAGSLAPQTAAFTNPAILYLIDVLPPRTAP